MASKRPFPSFLIFKDKEGHWRWNFAAANGKVVAASSVAYLRRPGCIRAVQVMKSSAEIPVVGRPADLKAAQAAPSVAPKVAANQTDDAQGANGTGDIGKKAS